MVKSKPFSFLALCFSGQRGSRIRVQIPPSATLDVQKIWSQSELSDYRSFFVCN